MKLRTIAVLSVLVCLTGSVIAQQMIRTDHFYIYFTPGAENTARRVAEISEEVYPNLAAAFDAFDRVGKITVLIHDDSDFSNGFASYAQNRVEVWASDLEFELRGSSNWIRNVMTHELAHIFSLRAAMNRWFTYFQINFGRYNVNPDYVFSIPFYHLNVPSWYAEGIAQFEAEEQGNDAWDTHRDMLLRMAVLENDLLTYDEMGVFTKDGLHSEMIYNQGFALVNYIHDTYGKNKAEALTRSIGLFSFDQSIRKQLGVESEQLYFEWKQALFERYSLLARNHRIFPAPLNEALPDYWPVYDQFPDAIPQSEYTMPFYEGQMVIDGGFLDYYPVLAPDGRKVAYVSNENVDFALTELKLYNRESGEVEMLVKRVNSRISWTPDSKRLVYVKRKENFNDLFIYDLDSEKEHRISRYLRVKDPAVSPDGQTVAFVRNKDGSTNLGLVDIDGKNIRYLTRYNDGSQIYSPSWSPDGERIVFSIFRDHDRDIAMISVHSPAYTGPGNAPENTALIDPSNLHVLIHSIADERDPVWLPDGSGILFSSDRDGIFNLYTYYLASGRVYRNTSVIGGAFRPSISTDGGTVIYAGYHAANYNIYAIPTMTMGNPVDWDAVPRDYVNIYRGKSLRELYTLGKSANRLVLYEATPVISFSPNFVGNRFTINTMNLGLRFTIGDQFSENYFSGLALVGRPLKQSEYTEMNYTVSGFYQRRLPALWTQDRALAPHGYGFFNKRVIHDMDEVDYEDTYQEVNSYILQYADGTLDTLDNVLYQDVYRVTGKDQSRFDFSYWGGGMHLPINRYQEAGFQYMHSEYQWRLLRDLTIEGTEFFYYNNEELIDFRTPYRGQLEGVFLDAPFFRTNDYSFYWRYFKMKPTADAQINPRGVRLLSLQYNHMRSTVSDSLVYIESAVLGEDPLYVPALRKFPINMFLLNWIELIELPVRGHTLGLETLGIFMDQNIPSRDEVAGIDGYFPIRLYLGGLGTLSGYPYFTMNGSRLFTHRIKYTFPVFRNIGKQILHLYFDRLYGTLFLETGTVFNEKTDLHAFREADWLYDIGCELRMSVLHFYRIPATLYFRMAWPMEPVPEQNVERFDRRIYFGFRLGGSY
jgi:hypothetical protein